MTTTGFGGSWSGNVETTSHGNSRPRQTEDEDVQGAIGYRVDFKSYLAPELTTVYVDRIAGRPCANRPWLVENPLYKGVRKGLLLQAVCHSYLLGLGGRVNLGSLPSERTRHFYDKTGFIRVGENDEGLIEYELSDQAAQQWLHEEGYL